MSLEYIIYTDESEKKGKFYSNFYGGVLVRSPDLQSMIDRLETCKTQLNLYQEVKWQKVTENYLEKYKALMDAFFDEVAAGRAKVRVMFTQNQFVPTGLSPDQRRAEYHLLYYQFIKHAFGLRFAGTAGQETHVRLNMDQLPDNREQNTQFKAYLLGLNSNSNFRGAGIRFRADQIAEVQSHDHVLLQLLPALDFLAEFTQHIPPPGAHLVRYYGWYSNKSRGMRRKAAAGGAGSANLVPDRPPPPRCERTWAMLIKRVYEVDPLACPECGGRMKVISFIEPPQEAVIERILRHCGLWRQEPNQEPRGPPEESERTFVPDEDDPLPPKERKRSAAGGELTFVDEATFWATF